MLSYCQRNAPVRLIGLHQMPITNHIISNTVMLLSSSFVVGLCIGSFLNVVAYRLPIMYQHNHTKQCREFLGINEAPVKDGARTGGRIFNLKNPSSHCPSCNHRITPWENIPVISYFLLKGKCSSCKAKIPAHYPCVEFITGIITVLVVYSIGLSWLTLPFLILAWSLFTLALIDSRYQFLPDEITLPVLWLGIFISSLNLNSEVSLHESVIGAIAGYTSLWFFNFFYKLVRKKEGIGHGDFKLFSTLGAWLGWQSLLPIIVFSSTVGSICGVLAIILLRKDKFTSIPFGPFLTGAGFIFLLWGEQLNKFLWAS